MSELSVKKLNELKKLKCYTNKKISELTGISHVTIDNIFCGKNKNPTVTYLIKIARALDCAMDDLIEYDNNSPLANYYEEQEISKLAKEIKNNPKLKEFVKSAKNLSDNDIELISRFVKRLKHT